MPSRADKTDPGFARHSFGAVAYARVSSKEQEKEGFSIPAQLKLLRGYSRANGLRVVKEYVDVETAKQAGRSNFGEMVAFLRDNRDVRVLLVEKTDRLYRNLKDWVTVDELDLEIHFVKENVVLSAESRSSEKFMHGIKVLMAKNYIDNLSEETRKGMTEKAEQGTWPSSAPFGYVNVVTEGGRKTIQPDPELAPLIRRMFEWYATGHYSAREITRMARGEGLRSRKSRNVVPQSIIHKMLRNRVYMGEFVWAGKVYQGDHEPPRQPGTLGAGSVGAGRTIRPPQQTPEARLRFYRPRPVWSLWLLDGRGAQERALRLLPLQSCEGEMSRALHARRGPRRSVRRPAGRPEVRR